MDDILFYNNLDAIDVIAGNLRSHFKRLIYLCADYSEIDARFKASAKIADKILVIPKTMLEPIEKVFPGKSFLWPQPTSARKLPDTKIDYVEQLLSRIPKPRIIYAGTIQDRVNQSLYQRVAERMPTASFVSVEKKFSQKSKNIFHIPWLQKEEMLFFLSKCQVGFLPYDLSNLHNLHCVPLKLLDCMNLGLPVVITKLKNINDFHPLVYLAKDEKQLLEALNKALSEKKNSDLRKARKKRGEMHQTNNLVPKLEKLIKDLDLIDGRFENYS